jgi:hypothetical protein
LISEIIIYFRSLFSCVLEKTANPRTEILLATTETQVVTLTKAKTHAQHQEQPGAIQMKVARRFI